MIHFSKTLAPVSLILFALTACGGSSDSSTANTASIDGQYSAADEVTCDGKVLSTIANDARDSFVISQGTIRSTTYKTSVGAVHTCFLLDVSKITSIDAKINTMEVEAVSAEEVCLNDKGEEVSRVDYLSQLPASEKGKHTFNFVVNAGRLTMSSVLQAGQSDSSCKAGQTLSSTVQKK